jgi:predicted ATPase
MPLALELAAARLESLTAEQVAHRLNQRFRLLTGGSRAALPRQQTLSATLRWSYDLLGRPERRLFERLAVFAAGWSLEAAEAVCAGNGLNGDDILDVLAHLTRKSLVVAEKTTDGTERFWMLETVRDYARQQLAARGVVEINALRDRHADFYASQIERLLPDPVQPLLDETPEGIAAAFTWIDAEYHNFQTVLAWWLDSEQVASGIWLGGCCTVSG